MSHHWGYLSALGSAVLFGLSSTLNKIALNDVNPLLIAGLIYFIGGLFLLALHYSPLHKKLLALFETTTVTEHTIVKKDYKTLGLIILCGSVIAPVMLLQGLQATTAINVSLLLSTESFFTAMIAFSFLRERGTKRDYFSISILLFGVIVVATNANFQELTLTTQIAGNLLIIGACLFWGLDNTLSKFLSKKTEIIYISGLKCLLGGSILLILPWFLNINYNIPLSSLPYIFSVGSLSIALSILLFLFSLREIGSMRTGSVYATSSLFGAFFAFLTLGEPFSIVQLFAGLSMLLGVYLLCRKCDAPQSSFLHKKQKKMQFNHTT